MIFKLCLYFCCLFCAPGTTFLCSEVIAPIRSEVDDISLYIINFEDLSNPLPAEQTLAPRLSKCTFLIVSATNWIVILLLYFIYKTIKPTTNAVDRARASFKTKFGSMGFRDRGLRLAGYLTPPSDLTQEDDDNAGRYTFLFILIAKKKIEIDWNWMPFFSLISFSISTRMPTLEKIESGKVWSPSNLVPSTAATMTSLMRSAEQEKIRDSLRLDDLKIATPKV